MNSPSNMLALIPRAKKLIWCLPMLLAADAPLRILWAAEPNVAQVVEIGAVPGVMRFNVEEFSVRPGASVKIVFKNNDAMQHNLIICSPGNNVAMVVAQKAWAMGVGAMEKQFVPDDPAVLFHTRVVNPTESDTLIFTAPASPGDYPYVCTLPGHAFTMRGVMHVTGGGGGTGVVTLKDLVYLYYEGEWTQLPDFQALKPKLVKPAPTNEIDIVVSPADDNFGLVFYGELEIPTDDEYTFYLNSNDGSRLLIDDREVVEFDGVHAATGDIEGKVRLTRGAHQLQVQYFQTTGEKGLAIAVQSPRTRRRFALARSEALGIAQTAHLHVTDKPLVVRSFVAGGPPRSISVGLPGGVNYLFNAEKCCVEFGWSGMFLDNSPNLGRNINDRGGGWDKILGQKFNVGTDGFPLRLGDSDREPVVRFNGYRRKGTPQFLYTVDGVEVRQTVSPAPEGVGLKYDFELAAAGKPVQFRVNPDGVKLASSTGSFNGGVLNVPASANGKFSVIITQP